MENTPNQPWVRFDRDDTNPSLRGNVEGLKHLRDKIDEALLDESALMGEFDCEFEQIEVTDDYPDKQKGFVSRLLGGCCGIIALLVMVLGMITLVGLLYFGYQLVNLH